MHKEICLIQIQTKRVLEWPSETSIALSDNFTKRVDTLVAELPECLIERRIGMHLRENLSTSDVHITVVDGRSVYPWPSTPEFLVKMNVNLLSNGDSRARDAAVILTEIVSRYITSTDENEAEIQPIIHVINGAS